jgi:hypothetical protein
MAIEISTPQEFMNMANWTDRGANNALLDIVITNDLDFSDVDVSAWTGQGSKPMYANIDGQGHTIKNLVMISTVIFYLFPQIYQGGVKNIAIDNCNIVSTNALYIINIYSGKNDVGNITIKSNCVFECSKTTGMYFIKISSSGTIKNIGIGGKYSAGYYSGWYVLFCEGTIQNSYFIGDIVYSNTVSSASTMYIFRATTCYNSFVRANVTLNCTTPTVYGINLVSSFYDSDLLPNATDTTGAQPTENIKSAAWLRSQGWAI